MMKMRIQRLVNRRFARKQNVQEIQYGILGDTRGNVFVSGKDNYVYARVNRQVIEVYNVRVTPSYGLPVTIGYDVNDPKRQQVLSARTKQAQGAGVPVQGTGYAPSSHYNWLGSDPILVDLRQILPLRINSNGGLSISVTPSTVKLDEVWTAIEYQTLSLASMVPETVGKAKLVLATLDTNGILVATEGDEVDISALLDLSSAPTAPSDTAFELALIRLYYGQVVIREANIIDPDIFDIRLNTMRYMTNELVGLENVTNDAQLIRSAGDFATFASKIAPVGADIGLLEDSEDSGAKKKFRLDAIPGLGGTGSMTLKDGTNTYNNVTETTFSGSTIAETETGKVTVTTNKSTIGLSDLINYLQLRADGADWAGKGELTSLADNDYFLVFDASAGTLKYVLMTNLPGGSSSAIAQYILIQQRVNDTNNNGGNFSAGVEVTRVLNSIEHDDTGVVTLSANQFTLPVGVYRIRAIVPAAQVGLHTAWLYNVATSAYQDDINGEDITGHAFAASTLLIENPAILVGKFEIEEETTFEIHHKCEATRASYGLGIRSIYGTSIYTSVELWKE
jgi:hypothetical protein